MTKTKKLILLWAGIGVALAALVLTGVLLLRNRHPAESAPTQTTLEKPAENVFTPSDFGYEGEYLTCLTAPCVRGIDVSSYQKEVDWEQVKAAGFEFAMIRVGYRGYAGGQLRPDKLAQQHYDGAKAAGLKIGCYFFSQAVSVEEAIEEANYTMEIIQGWELDMPTVYDWECLEEDYRTANVDTRTLTDCAKAFCDTVETAGYDSMVYFNPHQSRKQIYLEELTDYGFWLAMYSGEMDYPYKVDMWQYTNKGSVPGISGNVDINLFFPYEE